MRLPKLPRQVVQFLFVVLVVAALILVVMNELSWFFLLILLLILILLLWWLIGEREEEPVREQRLGQEYPLDEFFIPGEIIVRGPRAGVDAAVTAVRQTFEINERAEGDRIQFGALSADVQDCFGKCYGTDSESFVIDRYTFEVNKEDVEALIQAINEVIVPGSDVQAEPNWKSGHEWETAGSGWEPWDPTGSDDGSIYPAEDKFFMEQWAFQQIGLNSEQDYGCGQQVRIGVFDTWPSNTAGKAMQAGSLAGLNGRTFPLRVKDVNGRYHLHDEDVRIGDVSYHGYFVAGLAQAVARNAEIDIYRVLNKNNLGDLFSLVQAIFDFVRDNAPSERPKEQLGAVINLSLGIRLLPKDSGVNLPLEVQALRDILRAARCAGIVVIAAAGNRSENASKPAPADLPANWSEIIGVGSSNKARERSCFSNLGNIAAPGGDGRTKEQDGGLICEPANDSCSDSQCEFSVVGPYQKPGTDEKGYGFWSGTSFSTPMVAGLAACVIEKGQGRLTPDQVRQIIECGTTHKDVPGLGKGIINVSNTLERFLKCLEENGISIDLPDDRGGKDSAELVGS